VEKKESKSFVGKSTIVSVNAGRAIGELVT
jgi:hypothetical protein